MTPGVASINHPALSAPAATAYPSKGHNTENREDGFSYKVAGDGRVLISWQGRIVVTLTGNKATTFIQRAEGLSGQGLQLLLARATGNFKRGNERSTDKP